MHTALNYLDLELTRYRAHNAALTSAPLPHIAAAHYRDQVDRLDRVPHIDAEARRIAAADQLVRDLDVCVSQASVAAGVVAAAVGIGAGVQVVTLFVGGVL